ncbi:MAG: glycosyltransferase family 2 protein [Candidatus Aminicenantes bacterium]|nr:glycosyltransferase family 2 protein [Candidatus Aminicenantes bacterium]
MKPDLFLSVIIPVYNEETRLFHLDEVINFFNQFSFKWELVVVNDGSTDLTFETLQKWREKHDFKIISYSKNRGKGYAIKQGMIEAKGQYRLFMDIDLSTPLEEFYKFFPWLEKYDILIGTRKNQVGEIIQPQPKLREMLGKGFTWLSQLLLNVRVSDFTCGFKIFSARAADEIFPRLKIERWGFDSEILFLAKKYGFSLKEIGVRWRNDPQTKVNLKKDVWRSLVDLIKIRLNNWRRLY